MNFDLVQENMNLITESLKNKESYCATCSVSCNCYAKSGKPHLLFVPNGQDDIDIEPCECGEQEGKK